MPEMRRNILSVMAAVALLVGCATSPDETRMEDCVINPPAQPFSCTMQYDPVCGCNGVTYGNACMARAAGVSEWTPGVCKNSPGDTSRTLQ